MRSQRRAAETAVACRSKSSREAWFSRVMAASSSPVSSAQLIGFLLPPPPCSLGRTAVTGLRFVSSASSSPDSEPDEDEVEEEDDVEPKSVVTVSSRLDVSMMFDAAPHTRAYYTMACTAERGLALAQPPWPIMQPCMAHAARCNCWYITINILKYMR